MNLLKRNSVFDDGYCFSGKNVLNQKSELQRALERQKDNLAKKELENHIAAKTPELEKVIADRARRRQEGSHDDKVGSVVCVLYFCAVTVFCLQNEDDKSINPEFLQARMKLKNRSDSKLS